MKHKIYSIITVVFILVFSSCFLFGCKNPKNPEKSEISIVEQTDTMIVIKIHHTNEQCTLLNIMNQLKNEELLDFIVSNGMITEINGLSNANDFSSCWMLYTSDDNSSILEWGTIEYNDITLGSAITGADTLFVIDEEYYIWNYQTFN